MSKQKSEQYLPLKWVERFSKSDVLKSIEPEQLRVLIEDIYSEEEQKKLYHSNTSVKYLINMIMRQKDEKIRTELFRDIDAISLSGLWAKNKQVFAFDKDFLDELSNTKTITMVKDAWDYLPYDTFYIDISANPQIASAIIGEGFFIKVNKVVPYPSKELSYYCVYVTKITEEYYFSDTFLYLNKDGEQSIDEIQSFDTVGIDDTIEATLTGKNKKHIKMEGRKYQALIQQLLCYLSSVEPDIQENEITKRTYRKPPSNTKPKNKFSEIQKWDIGVRFGTSFRKWQKEKNVQSTNQDTTAISRGTGTRQRPHSRRAHWSHYWYGHGDEKVLRPKWISAYWVNIDDKSDTPVVIHKVEDNPTKHDK
jgi:hypothetical protein